MPNYTTIDDCFDDPHMDWEGVQVLHKHGFKIEKRHVAKLLRSGKPIPEWAHEWLAAALCDEQPPKSKPGPDPEHKLYVALRQYDAARAFCDPVKSLLDANEGMTLKQAVAQIHPSQRVSKGRIIPTEPKLTTYKRHLEAIEKHGPTIEWLESIGLLDALRDRVGLPDRLPGHFCRVKPGSP